MLLSAMWAFGGPMVTDKQCNYKAKFSEAFLSTFAAELKGLGKDGGMCFDFFFDHTTNSHIKWWVEGSRRGQEEGGWEGGREGGSWL